jgi:hypothetical protein
LTSLPGWGNTVLTFEGLANNQDVNNFYAGVTFNNAVAAIAGQSLDATEFPPASGVTVAEPFDSEMVINFQSPITDFQALFTHTDPMTLKFSLSGNVVGSVDSIFRNNLAISGDTGTHPNEAIGFHLDTGFDSALVEIDGGYVMDNVSFGSGESAPEPATVAPMIGGLFVFLAVALRKARACKS